MINGLQSSLNPTLTTYAKGLAQSRKSATADFVCPRVPVPTSVGRFKKYSDANDFQLVPSALPANGQPNRIDFGMADGTFNCAPQALEGVLTKQDLESIEYSGKDPLNIQQAIINTVINTAIKNHENDVYTMIAAAVAAGTIASTTPSAKWSGGTTDPVVDIDAAIMQILQDTGEMPNKMVIDPVSWRILKNHTQVKSRTVYGSTFTGLTPQILAGYTMNPDLEIKIAKLVKNAAKMNPADKTKKSFILSGGAYLFIGNDAADTYDPSAFKAFMTDSSNVEAVYTYIFPNQLGQGNIVYWSRDLQCVSPLSANWLPVS